MDLSRRQRWASSHRADRPSGSRARSPFPIGSCSLERSVTACLFRMVSTGTPTRSSSSIACSPTRTRRAVPMGSHCRATTPPSPPRTRRIQGPDGTVHRRESHGARTWRHVRTIITHPDVTARLEWEWDGSTFGRIAIAGLEEDADPGKSCRILLKAVQLLRDYEWRGQAKAGRPELSDDDVRHDLEVALERCRQKGWEHPTVRQLADWHDNRYDPYSDTAGLAERTLRDRMRMHPQPFRELVPWIRLPKKG